MTTSAPADTQAPTQPTGLVATNTTASGTTISWTASTDNVAVADYLVYRDGTLVGTVTTPSFTDSGLTSATAYDYTVQARDAANNVSLASAVLSVRTSGPVLACLPQNGQNGKVDFLWTVGEDPTAYMLYVDNKAVTGFTVSGSPLVFTLSKQNMPDGIVSGTLTVELRKTLPGGGVWIAGTATVELSADLKKFTATCG